MIRLHNILNEMVLSNFPDKNFLKWLYDRLDNTYIFFDTETTGFKRGEIDQITQIAAVAVKLNIETLKFYELNSFNLKIKLNEKLLKHMETEPDMPSEKEKMGDWLFKTKKGLLHYTHYNLADSDKFEEEIAVMEKFDNFLKSHDDVILFAHKAPFDMEWVQFHNLFKESTYEVYDTIEFFKKIFFPQVTSMACEAPAKYQSTLDKFPRKEKDYSSAIKNLCIGFNNEMNNFILREKNAHDALVDCHLTLDLFQEGLNLIKSKI